MSVNLPGPVTAYRLQELGATILKIEPPHGDPISKKCEPFYKHLVGGQTILTLNLKKEEDRAELDTHLQTADILITATRPGSLKKLNLNWKSLHSQFPQLCHIALVGYEGADENHPGHDLNFQAEAGLIRPPHMPVTMMADLAGAEKAVSTVLAMLLFRGHSGQGTFQKVSLLKALEEFGNPLRYKLNAHGGAVDGSRPEYGIYSSRDGWIVVGCLEAHFKEKLLELLAPPAWTRAALQDIFLTKTSSEWHFWGREQELPISRIKKI